MSKLSFVKYQGAGNDFILIDHRAPFFDLSLVPSLCDRHFGIGADGLILLETDDVADFRMRIYNCDGSEADSCGNGLRCLYHFLLDIGLPPKPYRIATHSYIVEGDLWEGKIRITFPDFRSQGKGNVKPQYSTPPTMRRWGPREGGVKRLYIGDQLLYVLDTGVPHAVAFVPDVKKIDVQKQGAFLRHHPYFQPQGMNINFVSVNEDGSLSIRTFERGLERESLACGTGAVAVGLVAVDEKGFKSPLAVRFPGGNLDLDVGEDRIAIAGEVKRVFEGVLEAGQGKRGGWVDTKVGEEVE